MDKPQKLLLCREKNFKVAFPKKKEKTGRKSHECVNQFNYSYSKNYKLLSNTENIRGAENWSSDIAKAPWTKINLSKQNSVWEPQNHDR